jgi:hypothetical protein
MRPGFHLTADAKTRLSESMEVGMDEDLSKLSAQERADRIGCMIKAKVDAGEFKLRSGYLSKQYGADQCIGCAIGSLAYSLGFRTNSSFGVGSHECRRFIDGHAPDGLISKDEQYQLEMGYECWRHISLTKKPADIDNPFFQLGKKMSLAANHTDQGLFDAAFPEAKK